MQSFPHAKNGVAAARQEAFCADRHFFNASNNLFEAILPHNRYSVKVSSSWLRITLQASSSSCSMLSSAPISRR